MRRVLSPAVIVGSAAAICTLLSVLACGPGVHTISVSPAEVSVSKIGATVQLETEPRDRRGAKVSGVVIDYRSRDPSVATVSPSGLVTAISHGTTTVDVRVEGTDVMEFVRVVVRVPEKVVVRPKTMRVFIGGVENLTAEVLDHDGKAFSNIHIDWSSTNEKIATVEAGKVVGVEEGEVEIIAKSLDIEGYSKVRVVWSPELKAAIEAEKRAAKRHGGGRRGGGSGSGGGGNMDPRLGMFKN